MKVFGLALALACAAFPALAGIAGLQPDRRPDGAPSIVAVKHDEAWRAQALRGIAEPQRGVDFVKDQGNWYTPFTRPNLNGRYDLRKLHEAERKR